jgi:flagellar hook capping protein FlgD
VDINDPAYFVNKNAQPGTSWDMYGVKAAESLNSQSGTIGARLAYRGLGTLLTNKWAKNAPTPEMLEAYYRILMILTGGLNTGALFGPFDDRSQDDTEIIRQFVVGATAGAHRGLFIQGDAAMEDMDLNGNTTLAGLVSASLREASYLRFSGNNKACIDLIPTSIITTNGDIYGIRNTCLQTLDVLQPQGDGVAASYYDPVGANPLNAPYVASVFTDAEPAGNPNNHWQALLDGFDTFNLRSRLCDKTYGRLAYFWNMLTNVFGKVCSCCGDSPAVLEAPNNADGRPFVDLAGIGNNPLRQGSAVILLTLARADRVTVKIFDVSGRLVRTLADGQLFKAGKVDPALTWDGLDNAGRQVARGAYFASVKYENSGYKASPKMIVLR